MQLTNQNMIIEMDEQTVYTTAVNCLNDTYQMNWMLENSDFGKTDGFALQRRYSNEQKISFSSSNDVLKLSLVVEKQIDANKYLES